MNYDERHEMREEARINEEYQCDACGNIIDGYAALDPCIIDDRIFCDCCASDLTTLRMHEYINGVSEKTKELKDHCVQCGKSDSSVWFSKHHNEFVCDECHDKLP